MLFSDRSLWTMLHGLILSGGAMLLLFTALYSLRAMAPVPGGEVPARQGAMFGALLGAIAVLLWLSVLGGTYVVFPMYRAAPPEGAASLADFPRALLLASTETRWLHAFGMEVKEHMPWIAAMLATAAAALARRHGGGAMLADAGLRRMAGALLGTAFVLVAGAALLGVFINKVAPLW